MTLLPQINPVALKELRQLMRARLIVWGMVVLPIVLLGATGIVLAAEMHDLSPAEISFGKGLGTGPLVAVSAITGLVSCGAIPLFAAIKTILETGKDRLGLEFTTTLTPAQIVSGKITAVAIVSAIAVAIAMPFFVLSYLMRGVDLATTVVTPISLLAGSIAMFSVGLLPSCARRPVPIRITLLLLIYFLMPTMGTGIAEILSIGGGMWMRSSSPTTPASIATTVFVFVAVIAYCRAQAAAELAPPHLDGMRPLRITHAALFVASALTILREWQPWVLIWFCVALMILLRAAYYPTTLTRGAALHAPKSTFMRVLAFPFATGSVPSMVFANVMLAIVTVAAAIGCIGRPADDLEGFIAFVFEFGGILTIAGCAGRALLRNHRKIAAAIGKIVLGYIVIANALTIVAETDAFDRYAFRPLPCNIDGLMHATMQHYLFAFIIAMCAIALLVVTAVCEFREFRKP